jgi:uncharacterized protein
MTKPPIPSPVGARHPLALLVRNRLLLRGDRDLLRGARLDRLRRRRRDAAARLVVPIKILVPVWTLLGATSSVTLVAREYRQVALRELLRTLPTGLVGIAIGLTVFKLLDARALAQGLGLLVIAYGAYVLWGTWRPLARRLPSPRLVAPLAGVLGGAVGTTFGTMASVFYAIYFDAISLAKQHFRATMSAMILCLSILRGLGYLAVGEFSFEVLAVFAVAFPMMLVGILIGDRFYTGMSDTTFKRLVGVVLIVSGAALLVK